MEKEVGPRREHVQGPSTGPAWPSSTPQGGVTPPTALGSALGGPRALCPQTGSPGPLCAPVPALGRGRVPPAPAALPLGSWFPLLCSQGLCVQVTVTAGGVRLGLGIEFPPSW